MVSIIIWVNSLTMKSVIFTLFMDTMMSFLCIRPNIGDPSFSANTAGPYLIALFAFEWKAFAMKIPSLPGGAIASLSIGPEPLLGGCGNNKDEDNKAAVPSSWRPVSTPSKAVHVAAIGGRSFNLPLLLLVVAAEALNLPNFPPLHPDRGFLLIPPPGVGILPPPPNPADAAA